jgi:hypothetical protein
LTGKSETDKKRTGQKQTIKGCYQKQKCNGEQQGPETKTRGRFKIRLNKEKNKKRQN